MMAWSNINYRMLLSNYFNLYSHRRLTLRRTYQEIRLKNSSPIGRFEFSSANLISPLDWASMIGRELKPEEVQWAFPRPRKSHWLFLQKYSVIL